METTINTVVTRQSDKNYTKNGVVISNTKNTKTFISNENKKVVINKTTNTCFNVKNVGCSGLSKLFFN